MRCEFELRGERQAVTGNLHLQVSAWCRLKYCSKNIIGRGSNTLFFREEFFDPETIFNTKGWGEEDRAGGGEDSLIVVKGSTRGEDVEKKKERGGEMTSIHHVPFLFIVHYCCENMGDGRSMEDSDVYTWYVFLRKMSQTPKAEMASVFF